MKFTIDTRQERMSAARLSVFVKGSHFSSELSNGVYVDSVTNSLMLRPRPLDPEWVTSNSGNYTKYALADFTVTDASKWENRSSQHIAGNWVSAKDNAYFAPLITNNAVGKNNGLYFSYFSAGSGNYLAYKIGYGNTAEDTSGLHFEIYSNGVIKLFRGDTFVGSGTISTKNSKTRQSSENDQGRVEQDSVVEVLIIPCRNNSILFLSPVNGGGFLLSLDDIILSGVPDPEITPNQKVWISPQEGVVQFLFTPIRYHTTGYSISKTVSFFEPPVESDTLQEYEDSILGVVPFRIIREGFQNNLNAELLDSTGQFPFDPDGEGQIVRIKTTLNTADPFRNLTVYGVEIAYNLLTDFTDDSEEKDLTLYCNDWELDVSETGELTLNATYSPNTLDDDFEEPVNIVKSQFRPCRFEYSHDVTGPDLVINGYMFANTHKVHPDDFFQLDFEVYGPEYALKAYQFVEELSLDKMTLSGGLKFLVRFGLFKNPDIHPESELVYNIEETDFIIGQVMPENCDESAYPIKVGANPLDEIINLIDTFANNWVWGFRPIEDGKYEFFAGTPEYIYGEPVVTVFCDNESYQENETDSYLFVAKSLEKAYIPIEANDVRITGQHPVSKELFQIFTRDRDSQRITTPPSQRPDNWAGMMLRVGYADESFYSEELAEALLPDYFNRLSSLNLSVEFEGALYYSTQKNRFAWVGDVISLDNQHNIAITVMSGQLSKHITKSNKVDFRKEKISYQGTEV